MKSAERGAVAIAALAVTIALGAAAWLAPARVRRGHRRRSRPGNNGTPRAHGPAGPVAPATGHRSG